MAAIESILIRAAGAELRFVWHCLEPGRAGVHRGEKLHGLAKRHDVSRNLIRIWVRKYEEGAFDDEAQAADMVQEYEARIAALERLVASRLWNLSS